MSLSRTEEDLIMLLASLDISKDTTVGVCSSLKTDENKEQMIEFIIHRYEKKGEVTEQDILKASIIIENKKQC